VRCGHGWNDHVTELSYPLSPRVSERGPLEQEGQPTLHYRWAPTAPSSGTVLILHGFGEHSGRYEHVLDHLAASGFSALAIDYRGWGLAEGERGCLRSFDEYVVDALRGLDLARRKKQTDEPLFLLGHSQGGLLAALTVMQQGTGLAGLILSGPGLGIAMKVPLYKRIIAQIASRILPDLSLPSDIPTEWLTTDEEMQARTDADPLFVRNGTARWLTETLRTQAQVLASASTITLPTLFLIAGDERLVSTEATRRFHDGLGATDISLIEYPNLRHELFNEVEREKVFADLVNWLRSHASVT